MKDLKAIQNEYDLHFALHKKTLNCHSINVESYKILCKEFFSVSSNKKEFIKLAEEANISCNLAEKEFILWLNRE